MSGKKIARIREKIRTGQYDMTVHAMEEMAEDFLDITDIEWAILHGNINRTIKDDPRGTKYIVEGNALDQKTAVGIVERFTGNRRFLIITVYKITNNKE
jgi:hypothetical protein